jgi:hypothetical protein
VNNRRYAGHVLCRNGSERTSADRSSLFCDAALAKRVERAEAQLIAATARPSALGGPTRLAL